MKVTPDPDCAAEVAEDHPLDHHGRAPFRRQADIAPVELGFGRIPGAEHLAHAADHLAEGVVDEPDAQVPGAGLVVEGQLAHLLGREVQLAFDARAGLELGHDVVEEVPVDARGHGPGLQEAPVGVPGRPLEARLARQGLGQPVVESHVDEGGHEPRHGDGRSGPDGEREQPVRDRPAAARSPSADGRWRCPCAPGCRRRAAGRPSPAWR